MTASRITVGFTVNHSSVAPQTGHGLFTKHPLITPRIRQAILVMILTLGMAGSASPARAAEPAPKPTIVLVHAAFDRPASWNAVAALLRADGYPVVVPANPLRSVAGDAAAIRQALDQIDGPIVLVGHSYGGTVITNAALGDPQVRALVYIAAFAPDAGESVLQLGLHALGSLIPISILPVPFLGPDGLGVDLYINPLLYPTVFAADVPLATAQAMAANQHPLTLKAFTDPSGPPAWKAIPSWYMVARQDQAIPPATERFMAQRAGSHTIEIDSSHAAPVSHPGEVADVIRTAAG
jgi:pimeloyl-ACP methyl ester carboxylesterase